MTIVHPSPSKLYFTCRKTLISCNHFWCCRVRRQLEANSSMLKSSCVTKGQLYNWAVSTSSANPLLYPFRIWICSQRNSPMSQRRHSSSSGGCRASSFTWNPEVCRVRSADTRRASGQGRAPTTSSAKGTQEAPTRSISTKGHKRRPKSAVLCGLIQSREAFVMSRRKTHAAAFVLSSSRSPPPSAAFVLSRSPPALQ